MSSSNDHSSREFLSDDPRETSLACSNVTDDGYGFIDAYVELDLGSGETHMHEYTRSLKEFQEFVRIVQMAANHLITLNEALERFADNFEFAEE